MNDVVRPPLRQEDRRYRGELDLQAERFAEPLQQGQRRVGTPRLDAGQIPTRDAHRVGDRLLAQVESKPRVATDSTEVPPDRHCRH
jgi:hypothetical protein